MSDKVQKIKEEIEKEIGNIKRYIYHPSLAGHSKRDMTVAYETLNKLLQFIDSLPEEPTKEDLEEEIKNYFSAWLIDLDNHKGFLLQIARHFAEWGRNHFEDKSEMVSDDLENAAIAYSCANPSERSDGMYDQTDIEWAFEAGAKWQKKKDQETIELAEDHAMLAGMNKMKEEMMENAVEAIVYQGLYSKYVKERDDEALANVLENYNSGDKVKIIIVKED